MNSNLRDKHILLGVTGSVAAYKAAEIARQLATAGCTVQAAMTPAAQRFVGAATMQAVTGRPVVTDMFAGDGSPDGMDHIAAVRAADAMLIAPASATTVARLANGMADDAVAALACAATCPVLVAPAMNREMWAAAAVRRNIDALRGDGVSVIGPGSGDLACGEHGTGRLLEPGEILAALAQRLGHGALALAGRRVVVSAGATVEPIDAMRVVSNRSSGRMGCALAAAARDAGAEVHLLAGRLEVEPPGGLAGVVRCGSARQMHAAALRIAADADVFISAAAVADFRPRSTRKGKLARAAGGLTLELEPCADIVADLAGRDDAPYCVAFAAEAGGLAQAERAARVKMRAKGVPAIVASPLAANLDGSDCELSFIAGRSRTRLGPLDKRAAADRIVALVAKRLPAAGS